MTGKMKCCFTLIVIFITEFTVCYCENDFPFVSTKLGDIKGHYKTSYDGKKFAAFEGIPFAAPPVGKRRFQDPEPVSPWKGIWDATHLYECIQYNNWSPDPLKMGDEDCLYINVYVPNEKPIPNENLEVIVHIHGGGFMIGGGHFFSSPDYLIDRNVIVVTFNYRLGIFGFLSTGDRFLSGNYGLKDQTLALKWIQEHVSNFGGNPNSVTLTGGSSGSASVHYHYVSPWSKGLFHRGMANSGSILNPWVLQEQPLVKAKQLAVSVGCPDESTEVLAACLRNRPAALILDSTKLFFRYQNVPFAPVIDKNSANPFVPDNPYVLLSQGKIINDVPLILSSSADEGLTTIAYYVNDIDNLNKNWPKIAPYLLDYNFTVDKSNWETTAERIKDFYLDKTDFSKDNLKKLSDLIGDRLFLDGIETAATLQAKFSKSAVYFYLFNFEGNSSFLKDFGLDGITGYATNFTEGFKSKINRQCHLGVPHCSDVKYIFTDKFERQMSNKELNLSEEEIKMKDILLDLLLSYAKTGVPKVPNVEFKPTSYDQLTFLNISSPDNIKLQTVEELTPRTFWKQLGILENENVVLLNKDEL